MRTRGGLMAGAVAAVVASELALAADGATAPVVLSDALAGAALLAVAVVATNRPQERRFAAIAGLAALAWLAGNVMGGLGAVHRPLLVHAVLGSTDGRLRGRLPQAVVAAAWATSLLAPRQPGANLALAVAVAAAGVHSAVRSSIARRPSAAVIVRASIVLGIAIAGPALARLTDPVSHDAQTVATAYACLVAVTGGILLAGLLARSTGAPDVANAVVELSDLSSREVDEMIASLRQGEVETADPVVAAALDAVAELLDDNRALHDALAAQVDEVRRSRLRLVEAADFERRRLARRLAEGAGHHLDELAATLGVLTGSAVNGGAAILTRTAEELAATRDDLDQLAQGLHPRMLVEEGLRASLSDLGGRAIVPTEVSAPDARFSQTVETTVWYVCAEAAANVAKHANARAMTIDITVEGDDVVATVADDGIGGADAGLGRGLAGLIDRLDAVGGRLEVGSNPGGGTRLRAWVPGA